MDKQELKKAKQAGRREARVIIRDHLESLEPTYFARQYLKDKPKYIPNFIWAWMVKLILRLEPNKTIKISLTGKDYYTLVSGDLLIKNGVHIILKDVGFKVLTNILNDVSKRNA